MSRILIAAAALPADQPMLVGPAPPGLRAMAITAGVLHAPGAPPTDPQPLPAGAPLLGVIGAERPPGLPANLPLAPDWPSLLAEVARRANAASRLLALAGRPATALPAPLLAAIRAEGARIALLEGPDGTGALAIEMLGATARIALGELALTGTLLLDASLLAGPAPALRLRPLPDGAPLAPDAGGRARLLLDLPAEAGIALESGAAGLRLDLRLRLLDGQLLPASDAAPARRRSVTIPEPSAGPSAPAIPGRAIALPAEPPRAAGPQPRLPGVALPGAEAPLGLAGDASFTDLKLHQHLANPAGTYRHLEVTLVGVVGPAGLWRQLRTKLFDRRGVLGLEFREMAGWPQIFDQWPGTGRDNFGPFWRLESDALAAGLAQLTTPHDRALVLTLAALLPALAQRGAEAANLPAEEQAAWVARGRALGVALGRL
jgi:hypothetical protein